jgi:cell division protein FtsB
MKKMELSDGPRLGLGAQVLVVVLVLGLAGAMAIGPTRQLIEQRSRIESMADDLRALQRSNQRLEGRIARLKDPDYLEREAREQSGLVRPGETSYIVMPPNKPHPGRPAEQRPDGRRRQSQPGFAESLLRLVGVF